MSDIPRFTPAAQPPTIEWDGEVRVDVDTEPRCVACGDAGLVDAASGTCRPCWRVLVALPRVMEERAAAPIVVAELDEFVAARARREVPLLTDAATAEGTSVHIALEPPPRPSVPKLGPGRRRP